MNAHTYIRDFQQRKKIRDLIPQVQNLNLPTAVLHTIFILLVIFNFNRRFWHRTYKYSKNCKLKARLSKTQANSLEGELRVTDELTDISSRFIKAIQLYIQKRLKPLWILNFLAHGFLTFQEACVVYLSSTTKKRCFPATDPIKNIVYTCKFYLECLVIEYMCHIWLRYTFHLS